MEDTSKPDFSLMFDPIFAMAADKGYTLAEERYKKEIESLKNDLLDALDLKEGKGPTALSMLKERIDSLTKERDELEAENDKRFKCPYCGYEHN